MKDQQLKAKFCRTYFTSILTFVNQCDINANDFGMKPFRELIPEDLRKDLSWRLDNSDRLSEEELMLGLEEFWTITETSLKEQRNNIVENLTNCTTHPRRGFCITSFIDEILDHFGGISLYELSEACPTIDPFTRFLSLLTDIHMPIHKQDEEKERKLQLASISGAIGITALLRKEWNKPKTPLNGKYKTPPIFEMPEQRIYVNITIKKPARWLHESNCDQDDNQERCMNFCMNVRKYKPFKVDLSYGKKDFLLKRIDVEQMLTYYYWNALLDITIPQKYETQPIVVRLYENKDEEPTSYEK